MVDPATTGNAGQTAEDLSAKTAANEQARKENLIWFNTFVRQGHSYPRSAPLKLLCVGLRHQRCVPQASLLLRSHTRPKRRQQAGGYQQQERQSTYDSFHTRKCTPVFTQGECVRITYLTNNHIQHFRRKSDEQRVSILASVEQVECGVHHKVPSPHTWYDCYDNPKNAELKAKRKAEWKARSSKGCGPSGRVAQLEAQLATQQALLNVIKKK